MAEQGNFLQVGEFSCRYCDFKCDGTDHVKLMAHIGTHPENTFPGDAIEGIKKQARAEVLAACTHAICVLCRTGEKPYLQSFGGKNWEGKHQEWVHDVKIEGRVEVQTCLAYAIHSLQPAASDLEEYVKNLPLSEIARIKGIPGIAKLGKTYDRPDFTCREDE